MSSNWFSELNSIHFIWSNFRLTFRFKTVRKTYIVTDPFKEITSVIHSIPVPEIRVLQARQKEGIQGTRSE